MEQDKVRLIKISKEALYEFIYEKFVEKQGEYLDVEPTEVSDFFDIDFKNGNFIFCAIKSEDEEGNFLTLPKEINLKKLMNDLPDTTESMFTGNRYKEYTKDELMELSKL
ncbi:MAG: hypothetical protein IJR59_01735 [Firmicutes bacterium]|nr:hypothetical protein [Bacillota bacterium]